MRAKLTKAEIIENIYPEVRVSKKSIHRIIDLFFDELKEALLEDKVIELRGFGTFEIKTRKGRRARNPKTGEGVDGPRSRRGGLPSRQGPQAEDLVLEGVAFARRPRGGCAPPGRPGPRAGLRRRAVRAAAARPLRLLFALSFPSFLSRWGFAPLAFVALVPLFVVVRRAGWLRVLFYGAFFGFLSYALFNFWLAKFHPLALLIVPPIHAAYFLLLFPLLKAAVVLFPSWGCLLQAALWVGYEYLKSQGFLAYSYGILGYSQYLFQPLVQAAGLAGVWGLSLLVVFPSAFLAHLLGRSPGRRPEPGRRGARASGCRPPPTRGCSCWPSAGGRPRGSTCGRPAPGRWPWCSRTWTPGAGATGPTAASLDISLRLSREALQADPTSSSGRRPPSCRPSTGTPATGRTPRPGGW